MEMLLLSDVEVGIVSDQVLVRRRKPAAGKHDNSENFTFWN
jgi:hypothetical protein